MSQKQAATIQLIVCKLVAEFAMGRGHQARVFQGDRCAYCEIFATDGKEYEVVCGKISIGLYRHPEANPSERYLYEDPECLDKLQRRLEKILGSCTMPSTSG